MHHALHVILANTGACHQCHNSMHGYEPLLYILEELLKDLQRLGSDRVFGKQIIHYLKTAVPG